MKSSKLVKQLLPSVAQIDKCGGAHFEAGSIDTSLRDRFTELTDALRSYDEKLKRKKLESAEEEQPSTKRPRSG